MVRRVCRSRRVLSVELITYHAITALAQPTVGLQWWRVLEWITGSCADNLNSTGSVYTNL